MTKTHWLLCAADDLAAACGQVQEFFNSNMLLSYDTIKIVNEHCRSACHDGFWATIEEGIAANRQVLAGLLEDLKAEGCREIVDLAALPLGYPSKVLHIIAHLLDGFIGIDSVFYNLKEDSHWLSAELRAGIQKLPSRYRLIQVEASFTSSTSASFIHHFQNK